MTHAKKLAAGLVLSLALLLPMAAPAGAQARQIDYVAFGDSVAAGVRGGTGEASSALGYTDLLAADLKAAQLSGGFNEDFCVSGATTETLKAATAALRDSGSEKAKLVAAAELVTVQIGANDLLAPFTTYYERSGGVMDPAKAKAALQQVADSVPTVGPAVQKNLETIIGDILSANPNAEIFVLGYYNPLPAAAKYLGVDLDTPMKAFNGYIARAAEAAVAGGAQVRYVDIAAAVGANQTVNLVSTDIHPTEAGYKAVAATLWARVKVFLPAADAGAGTAIPVTPSSASVLVNGKPLAFEAYAINGNNYFKLRDLAYALSGSGKQFNVWAEGTGSALKVMLKSQTAYAPIGGELTNAGRTASQAVMHVPSAALDGAALDFGVSWNDSAKTVMIDTSAHYTAD